MPILTNWKIVGDLEVFEKALRNGVEAAGLSLSGKVTGHSKILNDTSVNTSAMIGRKGDIVVTRSGSEYELGNPDYEFEQKFPGIQQNILAVLPDLNKSAAPRLEPMV